MGVDDRTEKLKHFFESDVNIKKEIASMAPPGIFQYFDEEKYCDKVEKSLKYIFKELKKMVEDFFGLGTIFYLRVQQLEVDTIHEFYKCGYDKKKLREFYHNYISNIHPEFVDLVKDSCVGYTIDNRNKAPIDKFTTANELLHYLHSYVMNSTGILQAIPEVSTKKNFLNYPITYRGVETELFKTIFEQFPFDLDVGHTDMVALSDKKLLMMVRDRGHALTIEITINGNTARLEYFIPKLCNVDMVNALPGVNKVHENAPGATGAIETPIEHLQTTIYGFISKVPMDKDMPSVQRALAMR